ncbi:MAG: thioredoxin-disulfide reductase [Actinomycetota bacterium]
MAELIRDVAVIGAGPAGLTSALYLGRARIDCVLLEMELPGGQAVNSPLIENYPGFPEGISGADLTGLMKEQVDRFEVETRTFKKVDALETGGEARTLRVEGDTLQCRAVVVATGRRPKKMGIPGEDEFTGRGISWCATCDAPLFRDKVVMVVGGGDAAVEEALHLARFASKVILVHRRDELRASSYLQERILSEPKVEFMWNSELTEIKGDNLVSSVVVASTISGERREVPVSGVFFYVGNVPNTEFLPDSVDVDEAGYIITDTLMETSIPGVFAAGDVRSGNFKQVILAAAEGAMAAMSSQRYLERIGARKAYPGGSA